MKKRVSCALCVAGLAAAGSADASVPIDLRVASNDVGNIADVRQYVPDTASVKTFAGDDCFDATPPIKQSSGASYKQFTPNALSAIVEASQSVPALQPVRISDADYASFGSLGVCQVNVKSPPGFFLLKANHQGLQVGADLFTVNGGDEVLAYRTPSDFSADEELDITAPVRTAPATPINVNVRAYGATFAPKQGANVLGGPAPVSTDAAGNASVSFAAPGRYKLFATSDYNDIPSPAIEVCVAADPLRECPSERGREILGSDEGETLKGTDGDDAIRARGGDDLAKGADGDDRIVIQGGGKDFAVCGAGKDVVVRDKKDKVSKSCEKVRGAKLKKGKKKKNGGKKGKK